MLRRRADGELEFLALEAILREVALPPLSPEQRERIWARIVSHLGPQEVPDEPVGRVTLRRRWIAIPLGAGVAAAIVAASWPLLANWRASDPRPGALVAAGELRVGGQPANRVETGRTVYARTAASLLLPEPAARLDVSAGSRFELVGHDSEALFLRLDAGTLTVASPSAAVRLTLGEWEVRASSGAAFRAQAAGIGIVDVFEGSVRLDFRGTERCALRTGDVAFLAEDRCFVSPAAPAQPAPNLDEPGSDEDDALDHSEGGGSGSVPGESGEAPPGHGGPVPGEGAGSGSVPSESGEAPPGHGGPVPGEGAGSGSVPGESGEAPPGHGGPVPGQGGGSGGKGTKR